MGMGGERAGGVCAQVLRGGGGEREGRRGGEGGEGRGAAGRGEEGRGAGTSHARPTTSCIATAPAPSTSARAQTFSGASVQTFSHPWPE